MKKRKTYIAPLLSIAAPGLGHIYCGKPVKGLILFGLVHIYFPIVLLMGMTGEKGLCYYITLMAAVLFTSLVMVYAIGDAFLLARRKKENVIPGRLNQPWVYALVIAAGVAATWLFPMNIRNNHVQAFRIPASSMIPNLLIGDYLFADKSLYKKRSPRRGEIVVFIYPKDRHKYFIKRVIGLPGDRIEIRGQEVILNGIPLALGPETQAEFKGNQGIIKGTVASETLGDITYPILLVKTKRSDRHGGPFTVPDGCCFVMGDNRVNSRDSRHFGPVPLGDVIGRADFIYFPERSWTRFGRLSPR
ncbi:LepB: predicted signal peptidase I [Desulfosarcina variabilis str. Montpellier]|uniref:signal peptidase I n=1 Tax=Desulfosarcina variabilis TaxID=2300 RepID=UPI003AFA1BDF